MALQHISSTLKRLPGIWFAYESPPEESLGERIADSLAPGVRFNTQVWVDTAAGPFRLDMCLRHPSGRSVAIEVDGRDFHDANRDQWRTVFLLCTGKVQVVYRVPAALVYSNLIGVLAGLATVEPCFFDSAQVGRWKGIVETNWEESDANAKQAAYRDDWEEGMGHPVLDPPNQTFLVNFRDNIRNCSPVAMMAYVNFAKATGLRDINQLNQRWQTQARHASARDETDAPSWRLQT